MFIHGEVRLFIMHAKRLVVDGLPGILVTYEPAPKSRCVFPVRLRALSALLCFGACGRPSIDRPAASPLIPPRFTPLATPNSYLTDRPDLPHVVRSFKLYGHGGLAAAAWTTPHPGASSQAVAIGAGAVAPVVPSSLPAIAAVPMVSRRPDAVDLPPPLDTPRCHELFGLANPKPGTGSGSTSFTSGDCASSSDGGGGSDGCGGSSSGTSDGIADVSLGWEDGVGGEEKETAEVVGDVPILDTEVMKNLFD